MLRWICLTILTVSAIVMVAGTRPDDEIPFAKHTLDLSGLLAPAPRLLVAEAVSASVLRKERAWQVRVYGAHGSKEGFAPDGLVALCLVSAWL